jgi:acyl dehydratase
VTAQESSSRLVTREEVRRFAAALRAMNPVHHDVEFARTRGFRDLVAPPFFFCTLGMSLGEIHTADQLRVDGLPAVDQLVGPVVAGGSSVRWFAPIFAGDELSVRQALERREPKAGRSGALTFYTYSRTYYVDEQIVVAEKFVRIEYR